jgi:hypothetical protein
VIVGSRQSVCENGTALSAPMNSIPLLPTAARQSVNSFSVDAFSSRKIQSTATCLNSAQQRVIYLGDDQSGSQSGLCTLESSSAAHALDFLTQHNLNNATKLQPSTLNATNATIKLAFTQPPSRQNPSTQVATHQSTVMNFSISNSPFPTPAGRPSTFSISQNSPNHSPRNSLGRTPNRQISTSTGRSSFTKGDRDPNAPTNLSPLPTIKEVNTASDTQNAFIKDGSSRLQIFLEKTWSIIYTVLFSTIHPTSKTLQNWNFAMDFIHTVNVIFIPLVFAWTDYFIALWTVLLVCVIDILLMTDCFIKARVRYRDDYGVLIQDAVMIKRRYLWKRNGVVDILASLPLELIPLYQAGAFWDWTFGGSSDSHEMVKYVLVSLYDEKCALKRYGCYFKG